MNARSLCSLDCNRYPYCFNMKFNLFNKRFCWIVSSIDCYRFVAMERNSWKETPCAWRFCLNSIAMPMKKNTCKTVATRS